MQHPPIDPGQQDLNYGANVDAWIRAWIVNENLQNRMALFPIPVLSKIIFEIYFL